MKNTLPIILKRFFIALSFHFAIFLVMISLENVGDEESIITMGLTLIIIPVITILGVKYFDLKYRYILFWAVAIFILSHNILFPVLSIGLRPRGGLMGSIESQTFARVVITFVFQFIIFIPIWIVQFIKFVKRHRKSKLSE